MDGKDISSLSKIGPSYALRLKKLGIETPKDLLLHIPHRYLDFSATSKIREVSPGDIVTIAADVVSIKNQYTRSGKKIQIATISDGKENMLCIWFNQPFLVRVLYPGVKASFAGKIDWWGRGKAFISPEYEVLGKKKGLLHTGRLSAVYPETYGVSSKWLRARVADAIKTRKEVFKETLPKKTMEKLDLMGVNEAVGQIHFPSSLHKASQAKKRLAFDELFMLQMQNLHRKNDWQKKKVSLSIKVDERVVREFISSLPYKLTASQEKAVGEVLSDLGNEYPANRLLEGDVGSGKTVVAAIAAFAVFASGGQSVIMAPTQILAKQHFDTLNSLFFPYKIRVALVTSGEFKKGLGSVDVFVGTHALLHKKDLFEKVSFVVIDEQHRFGVKQREMLVKKAKAKNLAPHVLTMTATPIPRTMAQTIYSDLDLSVLDEMPEGRIKTTTWVVPSHKTKSAYSWIKKLIIEQEVQAYIICPLIEESSKETMQSVRAVTKEYLTLKKVFGKLKLSLLHGKLPKEKKNKVVSGFKKGKTHILVSTAVVEVGIDVPNAAVMVVMGAERFGLAQLHQLRGRVGRGKHKSYCLLFSDSTSASVLKRLAALTGISSGFELAELDLKLRGPGEIFGVRQHGFADLKIASWQDAPLISAARRAAEDAYKNRDKYPEIFKILGKNLKVA